MKVFLLLSVLAVATAQFTSDDALNSAKKLTLAQFYALQDGTAVDEEKRALTGPDGQPIQLDSAGDAIIDPHGHWCCKQIHIQAKNWNTKEVTRIITQYRTKTFNYKTGYTKCGGLGWSRCSLYKEGYTTEMFTYVGKSEIEDVRMCPDQHIVCCHGYTQIKDGNCIRNNDIHGNIDLVDKMCRLIRLGLMASDKKPEHCPSDSK